MKHVIPYFAMTAVLVSSGLLTMSISGDYLPGQLSTFLGGVLVVASLVACFTDLRSRMIRNSTTLSAFAIVAVVYLIFPSFLERQQDVSCWGMIPHSQMFLGCAVCFFLTAFPYWASGKGAGDVKLAALFGAILGPLPGIAAVVLAYAIGAMMLFSSNMFHYGVRKTFDAIYRSIFSWIVPLWVSPPDSQEASLLSRTVPLGPGFCLAAFVVLGRQ